MDDMHSSISHKLNKTFEVNHWDSIATLSVANVPVTEIILVLSKLQTDIKILEYYINSQHFLYQLGDCGGGKYNKREAVCYIDKPVVRLGETFKMKVTIAACDTTVPFKAYIKSKFHNSITGKFMYKKKIPQNASLGFHTDSGYISQLNPNTGDTIDYPFLIKYYVEE